MKNLDSSSNQKTTFKGATGLRRVINAFGYSLDGLKAAVKYEAAFRQELALALILIPLAFYLEPTAILRIAMIGSVFLVLIVELINSAIEATIDRISVERHALAKRAKDVGSAAVLLALINLVLVWGLIFLR